LNLCQIALDAEHTTARGRGSDVDEQQLVFHELGHFGLLPVFGLDSKQTTKQEQTNLKF